MLSFVNMVSARRERPMDEIKKLVTEYEVKNGVTQEAIAEHLGITRVSFSRKLNGHVSFTTPEAFRLADLVGFDVNLLRAYGC